MSRNDNTPKWKDRKVPTGYTADIVEGISFRTYALNCARAFGACVTLREEPGGGEKIPDEFTPNDYHAEAAKKAKDKLAALTKMTVAERDLKAATAWDDAETNRLVTLAERRKLREAYEAMLAQVKAWTPPTPEHAGLHEFMRTQIEQSIDFDCDEGYRAMPTPRLTGEQWAGKEAERLTDDIAYHEKRHAEEIERAAIRTAWVRALRASLPRTEDDNANA